MSEAMRPAMQTDAGERARDPVFAAQADAAVSTVTMIEAANAEEEALSIAIALREAVQDGRTAALVTPDRALARRVAAALMRWNIAVEDTGGDPLAETLAGIFARLAAEAAVSGVEPVTLLALLKHPLLRLGGGDQRHATSVLSERCCAGRGQAVAPPVLSERSQHCARSEIVCTHPTRAKIRATARSRKPRASWRNSPRHLNRWKNPALLRFP